MKKWDKFQVNYHVNQKGLFEPFCSLLDCYDQICYFEFRKVSDFNRWIYFCDDINLQIDRYGNVSVMKTMVNRRYQRIEEYILTENYFEKIDELLKDRGEIALCTAFNFVSDFVWSEKGKDYLHTQHLTYIISEDQNDYYIVDSPWNLKNYETIRLRDNYSIVKIPKEHFKEAFGQYCRVLVIRFEDLPSKKYEEYAFLKSVLDVMISNYYSESQDAFQGRQAVMHMLQKCDLCDEKIFEASFIFHIMVSRRLLLERGLRRCSSNIRNYKDIAEFLNKSIAHWKKIKALSDDHLYGGKQVCDAAKYVIPSLIEDEDILMKGLSSIGETKMESERNRERKEK